MRIFLAGLLGAIAMFVWTSIAHVATPLATIGISKIQNEPAVHVRDAKRDRQSIGALFLSLG